MKPRKAVHPCREGRLILRISLPLILLSSVATLLSVLQAWSINPVLAFYRYSAYPEYILASVAVAFGGVFFAELAEMEAKK